MVRMRALCRCRVATGGRLAGRWALATVLILLACGGVVSAAESTVNTSAATSDADDVATTETPSAASDAAPEGAGQAEALGVTPAEIFAGWQQRQDRVRTVHIEWTEQLTFTKGSMFLAPDQLGTLDDDTPPPQVPAEDTSFEVAASLTLDGDAFSYRRRGPDWQADIGRFEPRESIGVGGVERPFTFHGATGVPGSFSRASVSPAGGSTLPTDYHSMPLRLAFRPRKSLEEANRATDDAWHVAPQMVYLQERRCLLLERHTTRYTSGSLAEGQEVVTCWLDAEADFSILRYQHTRGEHVQTQIDIEYRTDEQAGWVPERWTGLRYGRRDPLQLGEEFQGTVTACDVNVPADPGDFAADFPAGTWVRGPKDEGQWLVLADGTRRPITPEELRRGATYEELLATPSGQAGRRGTRWLESRWAVAVLAAVFVLGVFCWRIAFRRG